MLGGIAEDLDFSVTAAYVVPKSASSEDRDNGMQFIGETIETIKTEAKFEKRLIESKSVAGGIASHSKEFDLVVIGAAKEPFFKKLLFGKIPERVAKYSSSSVVVVKRFEGAVKFILKRIMG